MIPKGIRQTSIPNPKYTVFFRKRKILYKSLLVIGQKEQTFPKRRENLCMDIIIYRKSCPDAEANVHLYMYHFEIHAVLYTVYSVCLKYIFY